jgi:hypothetical protein
MTCVRERLIGVRKLHGIEVLALNVLDDRKLEAVGWCHVENDGRKGFSAGELAGAKSTLAHDELKAAARLPHDHRLQDAMLADRARELCKACRVEFPSGLIRVRID